MTEKRDRITNNRANVRRSVAESTKDEQLHQEVLGTEHQQQEVLQRQRYTRRTILGSLAGLGLTAVAVACESTAPPQGTATAQATINATATAQAIPAFHVYPDFNDLSRYVPSGFMGDYGAIKLTESWTKNPHSDSTCIQVVYSGIATQGNRWAGVYWQQPADNWGTFPGPTGHNLNHYSKLLFWVRGELGGEQIRFLVGGIAGTTAPYPDSLQPAVKTPLIKLTRDWQSQTISLVGKNLTHIIGGFGWVANNTDNPKGATFYLDDIVYLA